MFATRLFLDKDKRELFVALKHKEVKIAWLMNEKNRSTSILRLASTKNDINIFFYSFSSTSFPLTRQLDNAVVAFDQELLGGLQGPIR
ncbi:hypothetical protein Ahy_A09g044861 isoform A [Arachis hypogaea]|uniref:Uncharacterized protein n=1 Tax=Arachis hypogaea TaxID=3818 RepID=A0A445BL12_ARAHY|nr:hypothetical protein Ahy_A09g044861 isoform A [Arachis hypogaea]